MNKKIFSDAKFIWFDKNIGIDEFADFCFSINYDDGDYKLNFFVDGDYILYINKKMVSFNQYQGYKKLAFYDSIDITKNLKKGKNDFYIIAWHFGTDNFSHINLNKGVIFELLKKDEVILYSDKNILSRKDLTYQSGMKKLITMQLGYSYCYDANKENILDGFKGSFEFENDLTFFKRPNKKLELSDKIQAKLIKKEKDFYLFDLGKEYAGYPYFEIESKDRANLEIRFGEHIDDGVVRSKFDNGRDFSIKYICKSLINNFEGYFRRLGCRYLEVHFDKEIFIKNFGLLVYDYPINERSCCFEDKLTNEIYNVAVRTLKSCMHEHYEDCPWREQGLYTMDSRNQMLCSYYCFGDEIKDYIKSNLLLISLGQRENGILDICFPCGTKQYIPSFTLYYILQVKEYLEYTFDIDFGKKIFTNLTKIIDYFFSISRNGLIVNVTDGIAWNFYEWNDGYIICDKYPSDLIINSLFSYMLKQFDAICSMLSMENPYKGKVFELNSNIAKYFYNSKSHLFSMYPNGNKENIYSELGNSLAVLADVTDFVDDKDAKKIIIKELMNSKSVLTKSTLSMVCFKYDAILSQDNKNKKYVLESIYKDYKYMLSSGATTFWETIKGAKDFDGQASLCHGWSAMPIYYFNRLLK